MNEVSPYQSLTLWAANKVETLRPHEQEPALKKFAKISTATSSFALLTLVGIVESVLRGAIATPFFLLTFITPERWTWIAKNPLKNHASQTFVGLGKAGASTVIFPFQKSKVETKEEAVQAEKQAESTEEAEVAQEIIEEPIETTEEESKEELQQQDPPNELKEQLERLQAQINELKQAKEPVEESLPDPYHFDTDEKTSLIFWSFLVIGLGLIYSKSTY